MTAFNKKTFFFLMYLSALSLFTAASASSYSLNKEIGFTSRYIWRGFDLQPQNHPGLQPSLTWTTDNTGFSVNVWANIPLQKRDLYNDELDVTLSYSTVISPALAIETGFINYGWYFADQFEWKDHTSQEFYMGFVFPKLPLTPFLTAYYDVGLGDGLYLSAAVSKTLKLTRSLPLSLTAALGFNNGQWLPENSDTGLSDTHFSASLPLYTGAAVLTASLNYMHPLLDCINKNDEIWFTLSLN